MKYPSRRLAGARRQVGGLDHTTIILDEIKACLLTERLR
jgi:hypothetical protein